MKKLLKQYELNSDMQYYEMIVMSFINGQPTQAKEQFKAMPKKERIAFLKSATVGAWSCGLSKQQLSLLFDLI